MIRAGAARGRGSPATSSAPTKERAPRGRRPSPSAPARRAAAALIVLAAAAAPAAAHPHVFISSKVAVQVAEGSVKSLGIEWTFDELFSQMILADYDRGGKGSFTRAEVADLKKGAFDNLRNYHYFLALFVDGKPKRLPPIADFSPSVRGGRLVYAFSLPLDAPVPASGLEIRLTIYDDTYYVAFDKMSPSDVGLSGDASAKVSVSIVKTKVKADWPGQFMPDQLLLRFTKG